MKIKIVQTRHFTSSIDSFFKKRQLLRKDWNIFLEALSENQEIGDRVVGTGGVRKARIKSSSGGKSGGFRVCYYFFTQEKELYLLLIYPKNIQDTLTAQEKKIVKELVKILKGKRYE